MAIPSAFQKVYKLSTCLKASRLRRRRIFGVLLETRYSPWPLSLCLQSARLRAAALPLICARSLSQVHKFPSGTPNGAGVYYSGLLSCGLNLENPPFS